MKKIGFITFVFAFSVFNVFFISNVSFASEQQEKRVSLSINPLLSKINVAPGENWSGFVEIFNSNPRDFEFIIFVQDFRGGEEGRVEFIDTREIEKSVDKGKEFLLSQWIDINREPITISARESKIVPFTVNIPENAGPGGKYAAILAAIKPPDHDFSSGASLIVSPSVGSLLLFNVRGNVIESAFIREFSTKRNIYTNPEVPLMVRIQNDGNTHVHPRGDIKIYDRKDKVVEIILVNHGTRFGNILPQSNRSWNFVWEGKSFLEIGKYKAVITLIYGEEANQAISRTLYFWVFPLNLVLGLIGGILFILITISLIEYFEKIRSKKKSNLKSMD